LLVDKVGLGVEVSAYVSENGFFGYSDDIFPPKGHGFEKAVVLKWDESSESATRCNKITLRPIINKETKEVKAMFVRHDYRYKGFFDGVTYDKSRVWIVAPEEFNMICRRNPPISDEPVPERFAKPYTYVQPATVDKALFEELLSVWKSLKGRKLRRIARRKKSQKSKA